MSRGPLFIAVVILLALTIVRLGWFDSGSESRGIVKRGAHEPAASRPFAGKAGESRLPTRLALGQMIVGRFMGRNPPPRFLSRIRQGQVGGVIFFEENLLGGAEAIADRVERLREAAEKGGNPPLLAMVDQEGGTVKRLAGPPHSSAAAMSIENARREGDATGEMLDALGIDVDLAPVVDVGHSDSFLDSRTFASRPDEVASLACEFAAGLRDQGVAATLKHFPGLGSAAVSTDEGAVTIDAPAIELRRDYFPYRRCAGEPLTLVMVDSATYPLLTGDRPAVMSPLTYRRELPLAGATGVTISDDLETPAIQSEVGPARRSIDAGLDLLLYAKTESTSADAFSRLLNEIHTGELSSRRVRSAAAKILALKAELSG